ncbi:MAG: DUF4347 domain-containing protein, partial [Deltaproteobacteria bacterium]|nr:DUF4347 domain-containing protein [Deltaproteobacteria bacterium]
MSVPSDSFCQVLQEASPLLRDGRHEIVFILDSLVEWQILAEAAPLGCAVVLLDGGGDALAQMADYLADLPP